MPVSGSACGYYTDVSFFGSPSTRRGSGQTAPPGDTGSASPSVVLPAGGSATATTATDSSGGLAEYGPAILFGGRPPADGNSPMPPSGAMRVSTKGKRTVTSTASVKNVGAGPLAASSVSSTCSASKSGVKGSTTIVKGVLATDADADGNPTAAEPLPTHPPVNHTVEGRTSTGDAFRAVFNEQETNGEGTITVRAVHLYLLGPAAKGDVVIAESKGGA